jgi:hypothetical protein
MQDQDDIINVDNDEFSPPEGSYPQEVPGATGYVWDHQTQSWQPIFGNEQ